MYHMREPEINPTTPPTDEPTLKVGLILEEDTRTLITCTAEGSRWVLEGSGVTTEIEEGKEVSIRLRNNLLQIESCNGVFSKESSRILLTQSKLSRPTPAQGLMITPISAGRGFHWNKDISATFSGTIEILPSPKGIIVVNHIGLEDYIASVISSEMSPECPSEFAKAQGIAARSWALVFLGSKHQNLPYTICNDDCCQRYQGTTYMSAASLKAVNDSRGEILLSKKGQVCPAYYSKSCGGRTDSVSSIFNLNGSDIHGVFDGPNTFDSDLREESQWKEFLDNPPLCYCSEKVVDRQSLSKYLGKVDVDGAYFRWKVSVLKSSLLDHAKKLLNRSDLSRLKSFRSKARGESGRLLNAELEFELNGSGTYIHPLSNQFEIRKFLHPSFLLSSAVVVKETGNQELEITGAGWGHGVGLCQIGALGMALSKKSFSSILKHYYPSYELIKAY